MRVAACAVQGRVAACAVFAEGLFTEGNAGFFLLAEGFVFAAGLITEDIVVSSTKYFDLIVL